MGSVTHNDSKTIYLDSAQVFISW